MYLTYSGHLDSWRRRYFGKVLDTLDLSAESEILDYGCGPGDFLVLASERKLRVEGVDTSERSISMARERGLVVANKTSKVLLSESKRYDAIIAQSVIEHVPDGLDLTIDFAQLLKPGGTLVLSAPTPGPYFWDDATHIRPYTPRSFAMLAELAGLECVYLGYVFAFLLNLELRSPLIFPVLNMLPISLGSNLVSFMKRPRGT